MAAPIIKPVNLSDVLQAIEDRLVARDVVASVSQVLWVARDEDPPHLKGQRDVLLRYGRRAASAGNDRGGGTLAAKIAAVVEVTVRTQYAVDRAATDKQWIILHDGLTDLVLDALWGFVPADADGNELTVDQFHLDTILTPRKAAGQVAWGDGGAAFSFEYLPKVTPPAGG